MSFSRFAQFTVLLNLLVIIWGGYTSASGSGDGCGTDWPLCSNLVAETASVTRFETLVEFTHRMTSGVALLAVIALLVWARRRYPTRHIVRRMAWASFVFIILESLLGAGLVIFEYVDTNESLARAFWQPIHLVNTNLLLGCLGLTAWWATQPLPERWQPRLNWIIGLLVGLLLLGGFGTIAALASTIFPSESFVDGVQRDFARDEHYLIRLRVLHPLIATVLGGYLYSLRNRWPHRWANVALGLFVTQYILGALAAVLLTPIWMGLLHLLLSDLLWLSVVFWLATLLATVPVELHTAAKARATTA